VWVHVLRFISFLSAVSLGFSLALDPRARLGGLVGRLGVLVRNMTTVRVLYWVNVSESSGAGSPGCAILG